MAQQLHMTVTKYLQLKDKLIPKHLNYHNQQRKKQLIKKQYLEQTPTELINRNKKKYMGPIGQIQTIMDHFDSNNRRIRTITNSAHHQRQRMGNGLGDGSNSERDPQSQSKMQYLISLPIINRIRKEAQRYRNVLNAQVIKQKQQRKARIMQQFGNYMDAQLRGNPKLSIKRRMKTQH